MVGIWHNNSMKLHSENLECLKVFRSKTNDALLSATMFVYEHKGTGKFLLARWLAEHSVFLPILELGSTPAVTEEALLRFRQYCHPQAEETAAVALRQAADNQQRLNEDLDHERREQQAQVLREDHGLKVDDTDGRVFLPPGVLAGA